MRREEEKKKITTEPTRRNNHVVAVAATAGSSSPTPSPCTSSLQEPPDTVEAAPSTLPACATVQPCLSAAVVDSANSHKEFLESQDNFDVLRS